LEYWFETAITNYDSLRSVQDNNVMLYFIVAVLPKHLTAELSPCRDETVPLPIRKYLFIIYLLWTS